MTADHTINNKVSLGAIQQMTALSKRPHQLPESHLHGGTISSGVSYLSS